MMITMSKNANGMLMAVFIVARLYHYKFDFTIGAVTLSDNIVGIPSAIHVFSSSSSYKELEECSWLLLLLVLL